MRHPEQWGTTWMKMAHLIAARSKDPSFQAGAVLVSSDNKTLLGSGFNGPPPSMSDLDFDWFDKELKRSLVCHAESNCLWFAVAQHGRQALKGGVLYVNGKPCSQCAKEAARAGIGDLVWDDENPSQPGMCDEKDWAKAQDILRRARIRLIPNSTLKGD
jgi:deoxycytidylate deaminase